MISYVPPTGGSKDHDLTVTNRPNVDTVHTACQDESREDEQNKEL